MNIGGLWFIGGGPGILENTARKLSVKKRRKIGIILLSGGAFLCIIGLAPMYLFQDEGSGFGGIGLLGLFITFFPIGIFISYLSIPFFRKFEDSGWVEDALFEWSFWSGDRYVNEVQENMKQQIDCLSCNQKLNIPFSYSGKISCPACGFYMEIEEGIIQAEENPSNQG